MNRLIDLKVTSNIKNLIKQDYLEITGYKNEIIKLQSNNTNLYLNILIKIIKSNYRKPKTRHLLYNISINQNKLENLLISLIKIQIIEQLKIYYNNKNHYKDLKVIQVVS
jgi:hypothetical protein